MYNAIFGCGKKASVLGRITTLVLCRQSPLNLHQFCLTRDSKYGLVGTDRNTICWYFALIRLYLALLFLMSILKPDKWQTNLLRLLQVIQFPNWIFFLVHSAFNQELWDAPLRKTYSVTCSDSDQNNAMYHTLELLFHLQVTYFQINLFFDITVKTFKSNSLCAR